MSTKNDVGVVIKAPNFSTAEFKIIGTSPYVQNKFSAKARQTMKETQEAGSRSRSKRKRKAKDFTKCYEDAMHKMVDGGHGIPAPAFRNAMIDACRMVGFKMTHAKCSVFVEADGFDVDDATPLVRITKGAPNYTELAVRLDKGVPDIHPRPMWEPGWEANVRIRFDEDQFSVSDVANLLLRAGAQIGVGEGRPFSKNSKGMGWGMFRLAEEGE